LSRPTFQLVPTPLKVPESGVTILLAISRVTAGVTAAMSPRFRSFKIELRSEIAKHLKIE